MNNQLIHESSPYLLSHADHAIHWFPWCEEAFEKASQENKPVFLSIGYSTCHWCHVMARESFEDEKVATLLNEHFVSVKVDREERPDLDTIYMEVCQAMTGSGGWPMSIFLTPEKHPFFAGTYFPKTTQRGMIGFSQLLTLIWEKWEEDKKSLEDLAQEITDSLSRQKYSNVENIDTFNIEETLLKKAAQEFFQTYDKENGGFGSAPKFPTPHNLLFLLDNYVKTKNENALFMAETTLKNMYKGGLFDHVGYGFCRYATDRSYQIPHFEKMLYDNALLIMAYVKAYDVTKNTFYLEVAQKTGDYILREMKSPEGGFYTAQDADSDGVEGKYYVFTPEEILTVLGTETGTAFNQCYGITRRGNFEGKSIPHLTGSQKEAKCLEEHLPKLREYRKNRSSLSLDDKILTSWNGLILGALTQLARVSGEERYFSAVLKCGDFILKNLWDKDRLFVSYRNGRLGLPGYLDDYAFTAFGMLELYQATNSPLHLKWAETLCRTAISDFWDEKNGGFFLSGRKNETLIFQTKETYDGAIPSGNAVMAHNLVRLLQITGNMEWEDITLKQLKFMGKLAQEMPMSHSFYLLALSCYLSPEYIRVVLGNGADKSNIINKIPLDTIVTILPKPTKSYRLLNNQTTYYVCTKHSCLPPVNKLPEKS